MYSRLSRNAETGDSDKEALFASAGGVEVSEFLGGDTRQTSRGAMRWSWIFLEVKDYPFFEKIKLHEYQEFGILTLPAS